MATSDSNKKNSHNRKSIKWKMGKRRIKNPKKKNAVESATTFTSNSNNNDNPQTVTTQMEDIFQMQTLIEMCVGDGFARASNNNNNKTNRKKALKTKDKIKATFSHSHGPRHHDTSPFSNIWILSPAAFVYALFCRLLFFSSTKARVLCTRCVRSFVRPVPCHHCLRLCVCVCVCWQFNSQSPQSTIRMRNGNLLH